MFIGKKTKKSRNQTVILVIALTVGSLHCKTPFSTREPEKPVNEQSLWIQPTSPNYVMVNLRNALAEKNITNYLRCLADTSNSSRNFRFIADPAVANANPGLFANWGKGSEQNYLNQMMLFLPKDSTSTLTLTLLREDTQQDSVIMAQDYHLVVQHTIETAECPRIMDGQVEFRLLKSSDDLWYIYRWTDNSTADRPTWSLLRACFGK